MTTESHPLPSGRPSAAGDPPAPSARHRALGLGVLLLGGFVTIFDLFVVNVAIPSMRADLGASFAQVAYVVAGYELAFGVLLITGGRLGDLLGRRRMFIAGMGGFTVASALCGLAPSAEVLVAARVLQGLAAAILFPQIYASIRVTFDGDERRRAFGLLGMSLGLAAIAGQVLGGWMVHANLFGLEWRSIFLINLPIGLGAMLLARFLPESRADERPGLDWTGAGLVSLGFALLLAPLIEGPSLGWPTWTLLSLGASVAVLGVFMGYEARLRRDGGHPLVDTRLLTQGRFAMGGLLVLLIFSTSSSFFLGFALTIQSGFGLDPLAAGSLFAPCSVGFVAASLLAPRLVSRHGTAAIVAGALAYAIAYALLVGQLVWAAGDLAPLSLLPVLVLIGVGQGFIMTPLLNLVLGYVDERQAGMASGVISTLQQVGAALGVSITGIFFLGGLADAGFAGAGFIDPAAAHAHAFSRAMLYNLGAAVAVFLLLLLMNRRRPARSAAPCRQ